MSWRRLLLVVLLVACGAPDRDAELRQGTASYRFNISTPKDWPVARDDVTYVILVRDRATGQPIERGEGRIFASAAEGITTTLVKSPQVGQYTGTIRFPNAGGWTVGIRFRSDTTRPLERTQWIQEVRATGQPVKTAWITPPWSWRTGTKK